MTFLIDRDGGATRRELMARAVRVAGTLDPHEPVLIATTTARATVVAVLAASYAGARPTLIGVRGGPPDSTARVLGDDLSSGRLRPPRLPQAIALTSSGTGGSPHPTRHGPPRPRTATQHLAVVRRLPRRPRRLAVCLPPTSGHGWAAISAAWLLGAGIVDVHRLRDKAPALLEDAGADAITGLPDQLQRLTDDRIRLAISGSDILRPQLSRELSARTELLNVYGATEAGPIAVATPDDLRRVPGCVGRPLPGVRVRVEEGVIEVRTPLTRRPLRTDRGRFENGLLVVEGRADGRPTRRGETPDVARAEAALRALGGVRGIRSEWDADGWTVVLEGPVWMKDVRGWLVARVGPRDCPDRIVTADQQIRAAD